MELGAALAVAAFAASEFKDFYFSVAALIALGIILSLMAGDASEAALSFVTLVVLVPAILLWTLRRTGVREDSAAFSGMPSVAALLITLLVTAYPAMLLLDALNIPKTGVFGALIILIGTYCMLTKSDVLKVLMGFVMVEAGFHQILSVAAHPSLSLSAVLHAVLLIAILTGVYIAMTIHERTGSFSTMNLKALRW